MEPKKPKTDSQEPFRKPYEAPRVLYREPLEAVATTCTPAPPAKATISACPTGPLAS